MKTLQIGTGWLPESPGGLERMFYEFMLHLPQVGCETVGLVTGSDKVYGDSNGRVRSFAPATASIPKRWRSVRKATRTAIEEHDFSLVVSHFALYALPSLDILSPLPHVVHFQGPWAWECFEEGDSKLSAHTKAALERAVYKRADHFIVLSRAFRDILHEAYGIPHKRISIVPCGVDVDRFDIDTAPDQARRELGWPLDRPIILAVRRLVNRMGLENLIDSMHEVVKHVPEALLLIAGKGPLAARLRTQVRDNNLERHVKLLGFVPEAHLPLAYRAADLTVVPTVALEGMGCITLESLAAGTRVLVTPVGGLPEAVEKLSSSMVLKDASISALSEGITAALTGELWLPNSKECVSYVRNGFDWPHIARKVRDVYELALATRSR